MLDPALFESIFLRAPVGAYLLTPTPDAVVLAVNDFFLANTGRTREEMIGRSLFEIFPRDPGDPGDHSQSALQASILRAVDTGQPQRLPAARYPIPRVDADGHAYFEERYWDAVNTPIVDGAGQLTCILHTTNDVTGRVRAEAALRRSEQQAQEAARQAEAERQRLEAVIDAVPVGIVLSDAQARTLAANNAHHELWGDYPQPEGVADFARWKAWWADGSSRHGQPVEPGEWPTARALHGEPAPKGIFEVEPFDRALPRRTVLFSAAPLRDRHGQIEGAVVGQLDISDRVRAEEALRQASRRKDEFLAMLAHELRNPLAPIGAAADLLATGLADPARIQATSSVIGRQVRHMAGLIDELLDVSRVTRGLIRLETARIDLKRVVADALEQTRPLVEARGHRIAVHVPPEPAIVLGDRKRLVQVVANLLTNAAKYTPEGGEITVDTELDGVQVKVHVTDTGIGMAPELVTQAFELFAQAERSADRAQGGLGIGLALVESLITLHGGSVCATSEGHGRGSRFTLSLPRLDVAPEPTVQPTLSAPTATVGGLKVLVVDDNRDAAAMLALLVETLGHVVVVEHGPRAALELARTEKPQVCLLDVGLPEMDGVELARRLRAQPETAAAVMVAVTGYGQERDRARALEAGFDHYFVKPVDGGRLGVLLGEVATQET